MNVGNRINDRMHSSLHVIPLHHKREVLLVNNGSSDSESARIGRGAARLLFTGILARGLFGCSCELELTVDPPTSTGYRQVTVWACTQNGQVRPV